MKSVKYIITFFVFFILVFILSYDVENVPIFKIIKENTCLIIINIIACAILAYSHKIFDDAVDALDKLEQKLKNKKHE